MTEDILPPIAPGAKRDAKRGFFSRLFGKKQGPEPSAISLNEQRDTLFSNTDIADDKPIPQKKTATAEIDDKTLDSIRMQLGLAESKPRIPEPASIPKQPAKKGDAKPAPQKKSEQVAPIQKEQQTFELPSIDIDDSDELLEEAEEIDSKNPYAGLIQSEFAKDLEEPAPIKANVPQESLDKQEWTKDIPQDSSSNKPSDSGFAEDVPNPGEPGSRSPTEFINEVETVMQKLVEEQKEQTAVPDSLDDEIPDIDDKGLEPLRQNTDQTKPAEPSSIQEKKEQSKKTGQKAKTEKEGTQKKVPEKTAVAEHKEQNRIEAENAKEKEAIKRERQALEQDKITLAGKINKLDFKEKQINKSQTDLEMARKALENERQALKEEKEQWDKDKLSSKEIYDKLPAMRAEYEKLKDKIEGLNDQVKINKQLEENIKRREEALALAQKRLQEIEESIKSRGFSDYLESELKGNRLATPKIPNEDALKEKNPDIYNLIADCKNLVSKKKIAEAKEVYMRLRNIYQHMNQEDPLKELVYTLIRELYDDINLAGMKQK